MRLIHWLYVTALFVPAIARLAQKVSTDTGGFTSRFGPLLAVLLLAAGFIGYRQKKAILISSFWRWIVGLLGFGFVGLFSFGIYLFIFVGKPVLAEAAVITITSLAAIPALISLFKYSKPNNDIWKSGELPKEEPNSNT
ncbi:hypothetical protein [Pelagicoccus albus]|uniref:Uncharacterized protein n=1 Tax=Pelagicoccus albus TaxID=415222 RepID=A0A7X1EB82_9BACT|nr:hypothetical protein [Pelagicoccus albus]MBC2607522.1 hypothetical protein [Pelagicoccus albus]